MDMSIKNGVRQAIKIERLRFCNKIKFVIVRQLVTIKKLLLTGQDYLIVYNC